MVAVNSIDIGNERRMRRVRYIVRTISAAKVLGIAYIMDAVAPRPTDIDVDEKFCVFQCMVDGHIEQIKIGASRQVKRCSVAFDVVAK